MGDMDWADFAHYSFVGEDLKRGSNQSAQASAGSISIYVNCCPLDDQAETNSAPTQLCLANLEYLANSSVRPQHAAQSTWQKAQQKALSFCKKHSSITVSSANLDSTQPLLQGFNSSTAFISSTAPQQSRRPSTPPRFQIVRATGSFLAHRAAQGMRSMTNSGKNLLLFCCSAPAVVCDFEEEHCALLASEPQAEYDNRSSSDSDDTDECGAVCEIVLSTQLQTALKALKAKSQAPFDPFEQLACQPKVLVEVSAAPATATATAPAGSMEVQQCSSAAFNSFSSIAQGLPRVLEEPKAHAAGNDKQVCLTQQQQQQQQVFDSLASPQFSFGSSSIQNERTHMEDRVLTVDLTGHPAFSFTQRAGLFAVFDGHGGHQTAQYLAANILPLIVSDGQAALRDQPVRALQTAISRAENDLVSAWTPASGHASGSTLCLALLLGNTLHVANVGDSGAVLAQGAKAVKLTAEHKASDPAEAQCIRAADPSAHVTADGYLYGELGVSRGLGSAHIKTDPTKRAFVATPEVISLQLSPTDDFLVLATDGLWDKVPSQEAVAAARKSLAESKDPALAAHALAERAQKYGSQDNISVVVALLHNRGIVLPKNNSRLFSRRTSTVSAAAGGASDGGAAPVAPATPAVSEGGAAGGAALCVV